MSLSPALQAYLGRESWHRSPVLVPRGAIPFAYQHVYFENRRPTPAIRATQRIMDDDDYQCRGVVLQGGVGAGKTTAAVCLVRALIEEGSCEQIASYTFGGFARRTLNGDHPMSTLEADLYDDGAVGGKTATLEAARESDYLVFDDVGSGYTKRDGFVVEMFEEIVIHREAALYPMLITTNCPPAEFRSKFGDRVFDRLRGSWGAWIDVDGPSLRRKIKRSR